jgi:ribosomal protein S18 acetylase RimI-like enzyme
MTEEYGEFDGTWLLGDLDAAAVWLPPDKAAEFVAFEPETRASIEPLTDDGGARYGALWDWIGAHLPDEQCWFLDILAVDPRARGRGLAGTLVRHGLTRAFAEGLPAVLETAKASNVPMYEHLGFRVVEEAEAPLGGPTIWFMRAEPPG